MNPLSGQHLVMHVRLISDSQLAVHANVSTNESFGGLATCPGCIPLSLHDSWGMPHTSHPVTLNRIRSKENRGMAWFTHIVRS